MVGAIRGPRPFTDTRPLVDGPGPRTAPNSGVQTRTETHQGLQLLGVQEAKARFCQIVDDWRHPVTIDIIKQFAQSLLPREHASTVGRHWVTRFLNCSDEESQSVTRQDARSGTPPPPITPITPRAISRLKHHSLKVVTRNAPSYIRLKVLIDQLEKPADGALDIRI